MKAIIVFLMAITLGTSLFAQESNSPTSRELWSAMKETGHYMWDGFQLQFTQTSNLYWAGLAGPSLWFAFDQDKRISNLAYQKRSRPTLNIVSNIGVAMTMPFVHMGLWYGGKRVQDDKFIQFTKEYAATLYIALLESGALSYVPIHHRPSEENLSFWESAFRSDSSFPSGHIIPYASLFFKTLQFYGPVCSVGPFILTVLAGAQRVRDGKHYLSDVLGGFFLSAFASEGVRAASKYQNYHPLYKWWAQHDLQLSLLYYEKKAHTAMGPQVSFSF